VASYQCDGDLAAIGIAETLHAANRGEPITIFFVNNAIYGMTGGQMAPTTLFGQKTSTTPLGRGRNDGAPLRICELLAQLDGPAFLERVAVCDGKHIMRARRAIRKALDNQVNERGFSLVEILSACPTGWKMTPEDASAWVRDVMIPAFPLGNFRDKAMPPDPPPPRPAVHEIAALLDIPGHEPEVDVPDVPPAIEQAINVAGFGGQGVIYLGRLLAEVGMRAGLRSSFIPSYGPEMRGGTAHCYVHISQHEIGSPLAPHPNCLIAMNEPSLARFHENVVPGGLVLYNGPAEHFRKVGVAPGVRALAVPATEIADRLGGARMANMVMLGVLVGAGDFLSPAIVEGALKSVATSRAVAGANLAALRAGMAQA
jgi:2-oxoisovalerate ferredoxin oxidoreductase beta subunit